MESVKAMFNRAAKAWVAAVIPVAVALVADVGAGVSVDLRSYLTLLTVASAQWFAVYLKSNGPAIEVNPWDL
jgi:hypothetical protein